MEHDTNRTSWALELRIYSVEEMVVSGDDTRSRACARGIVHLHAPRSCESAALTTCLESLMKLIHRTAHPRHLTPRSRLAQSPPES